MTCEACQTIPPVITEGYKPKGTWSQFAGYKTYTTGPANAKKAVVLVYDIFGPAPQTLQGADGLASALGATVFVPDFLEETGYAQGAWFSASSDDAAVNKAKGEFFAQAMDFPVWKTRFQEFMKRAEAAQPGVESWGAVGLCWGGKIAALMSGAETPLKVSGQVHPGRLDAADAKAMTVPHVCLASNGEDEAVVKEYKEILGAKGYVEYYGTMHHGWMGARANLNEPENAKEYERGYNKLAEFFGKHL